MTKYDNSNFENWSLETRALHVGQDLDGNSNSRNVPIHQTTSYVFDSAEHAANRFNLSDAGPIYTRLTNPTTGALEARIASLEGGVDAVAFASGQAAQTAAIINLASAGDHIVSSPRLYGGTNTLFTITLARLGIEVTLVEDPDDPQSWADAVKPNTRAFYAETFGNPIADILDIPAVAEVAHNNQVPLIVDNTIATAAVARPLELGADIVVASTTKFYSGNGSSIGGILVDGGKFDWTVERDGKPVFPYFVTPDAAYHGLKYADLGAPAFALKARAGILRDTGAALSPFNAWVTLTGLETLQLRIDKHGENAQKVAEYLEAHDKVTKVNYAGLDSSPYKEVKERLGYTSTGSVLSFEIDGGKFDWTVERDGKPVFPYFVTPDAAYHGLKYADLGAPAFALKARAGILRDTGAALSPFNAWVTLTGLETLQLRIDKHGENAQKVAEYLEAHDKVTKVNYAGLDSSPYKEVKERLGYTSTGSVLSFEIDGGKDEAWAFIDALKLHSNLANIGDTRSLVVHPATTTHSQSDEEGLRVAGITQSTVRLSVGIENIADIIADLELGFAAI